MRALKARFRHSVFCAHHLCGKIICEIGDVSNVWEETGRPVNGLGFDFGGSHAFELNCNLGHTMRVAAPRDVQFVRGVAAEGPEGPKLTLRSS